MAMQNLINVGVTAADAIMLGKVGEKVLSGASFAGQVQYIMTLFLFGLTSGATVLTAQYWGKGDKKTIEKILGLSSATAIYLGKTIGERRLEEARAYAKYFLFLSVVMGVFGGAIILAAIPDSDCFSMYRRCGAARF